MANIAPVTAANQCISSDSGQSPAKNRLSARLPFQSDDGSDREALGKSYVNARPVVVYIDRQRLGRECIGKGLAAYLPEWLIESVATIRELRLDENQPGASLILLCCHGASLCAGEFAEEINAIRQLAPEAPLLLMSDIADAEEVHRALQLGARGYLSADLSFPQALAAIQLVCNGGTYIPPCILDLSSEHPRHAVARPTDSDGNLVQFSARQWEVLERLRQGKQNKIIAYELNIRESTVKVHIRHIM